MKKLVRVLPIAVAAMLAVGAVSCKDDDNENNGNANTSAGTAENVTTNNVFEGNMPASVDGATFTTNSQGQVTEIKEGNTTTTFEYGKFTRAQEFQVLMKQRDSNDPGDGSDFYIQVNKQGFAVYALQVYLYDGDTDEWWFEYDSEGQLTRVKRSEGEDDFRITWEDGDIITTQEIYDDGESSLTTISYTNSEYKTPVPNKGHLMLFDGPFYVDMDEFEIAYYAGLLGKSTKNLPMGWVHKSSNGESYTRVNHWEFNSNQFPTKYWEDDDTWYVMTFTWK